jgi:hypothetical protein
VLNFAYNVLCDGIRLEDIELRRNDEVFLNALGTERIPDPTTAGDFCRRFDEMDIRILMKAIDEARRNVWARQPKAFFRRATIDMDGVLVTTHGECKGGTSRRGGRCGCPSSDAGARSTNPRNSVFCGWSFARLRLRS